MFSSRCYKYKEVIRPIERPSMKPSLPEFGTEDKIGGTIIEKNAFALVVTPRNELQLIMPSASNDDAKIPQLALALIAVANKLSDQEWVEQLLADEFDQLHS
jgi:hypothetical protein